MNQPHGMTQRGPSAAPVRADERQYLTFALAEEAYGVDILAVQEIRGFGAVTPLPNMSSWLLGVMNLRGVIVPVVDLRSRLGLPTAEFGKYHVIIVMQIGGRLAGFVVDAVSDVIGVAASEIKPPPDMGGGDTTHVRGLVRSGEKMVILLDSERLAPAQVDSSVLA